MTRPLLAVLLFLESLAAQPYLEFLKRPVLPEEERRSMMYSYVEHHLPAIPIPASREQWELERGKLRARILELVGLEGLDGRGPVKYTAAGRIERDGYAIEKVLFESYPGMMVPALVYVPANISGTAPAVVSIPGHVYCEGKADVSVQARCVNLARRGIIAMTYDYIGTGERNTGIDACAGLPYGGGNDHGLKGFSYTSGTPTGLEILDGIRALDYLCTRRDVDRNRIGFTGESGGSNTTYWVSAIDERVRVAVPVCSVTTFDYWIRNDRNWDWHQRPPGIRAVADIPTLLAMFAPKPMLVIGALRGTDSEEFPFDQTEGAVAEARRAYRLYNAEGAIEVRESSTGHGYQQDKREQMYAFIQRHLLNSRADVGPFTGPTPSTTDQEVSPTDQSKEMPYLLESPRDLRCGMPKHGKTLAGIYAEWLEKPTPIPGLPEGLPAAVGIQQRERAKLRQLLGLSHSVRKPRISVRGIYGRESVRIRELVIEPEDGISLPAIELQRRNGANRGLVLVPGKSEQPAELVSALLFANLTVLLFDPRGTGETSSGGRRTDNWAWFVGRPWTGMWAADINAAVAVAAAEHPKLPRAILGLGKHARAALFAAALNSDVNALAVRLDEPSYRALEARGHLAEVPRVLAYTDLPIITAMLAPRACLIEHPAEAGERFQRKYGWPLEFYSRGFSSRALELHPAADTDWRKLSSWLARVLGER